MTTPPPFAAWRVSLGAGVRWVADSGCHPCGGPPGGPDRLRQLETMLREVVEKAGGEAFTDEDEEILVLFATQAATAIANARTYRAERHARADLEALIETSPVGVVVFDVGTGRPVSLNREARRIVEGLCNPGQSAEQLLEVITYRRADPGCGPSSPSTRFGPFARLSRISRSASSATARLIPTVSTSSPSAHGCSSAPPPVSRTSSAPAPRACSS